MRVILMESSIPPLPRPLEILSSSHSTAQEMHTFRSWCGRTIYGDVMTRDASIGWYRTMSSILAFTMKQVRHQDVDAAVETLKACDQILTILFRQRFMMRYHPGIERTSRKLYRRMRRISEALKELPLLESLKCRTEGGLLKSYKKAFESALISDEKSKWDAIYEVLDDVGEQVGEQLRTLILNLRSLDAMEARSCLQSIASDPWDDIYRSNIHQDVDVFDIPHLHCLGDDEPDIDRCLTFLARLLSDSVCGEISVVEGVPQVWQREHQMELPCATVFETSCKTIQVAFYGFEEKDVVCRDDLAFFKEVRVQISSPQSLLEAALDACKWSRVPNKTVEREPDTCVQSECKKPRVAQSVKVEW